MTNIDWNEIQKFYDEGYGWDAIAAKFHISTRRIAKARNNGLLILRDKSSAQMKSQQINPRKHSDETKAKISKARLKYLRANPDKVPYKLNHYTKGASYPERYFHTLLQENGLIYERYKQVSIYNLDFAFNDKMINLEIDGEQHYTDKRIIVSNKRRDAYLSKRGWLIIRVRWSTFKKMIDVDKQQYIHQLLLQLK